MMDKATEAKAALAYSEWLAGYEYKAGENAEVSAFYAGYAAALEEAGADTRRLKQCLAFFASVIRSGEPWSEDCEAMYRNATPTPADSAGDGEKGGG